MYKREVEDLQIKIKQLKRERESMLDLSPENATSLGKRCGIPEQTTTYEP